MSTTGKKYTWYKADDIASWPPDHKRCRKCDEVKHVDAFHKHKGMYLGVTNACKVCRKAHFRKVEPAPKVRMLRGARARSRGKGMECTIELDDIVVPELCPVLGVPLIEHTEYAPSIDRTDSSKGYTPDNIVVMSRRANLLKNNATLAEVEALASYMRGLERRVQ